MNRDGSRAAVPTQRNDFQVYLREHPSFGSGGLREHLLAVVPGRSEGLAVWAEENLIDACFGAAHFDEEAEKQALIDTRQFQKECVRALSSLAAFERFLGSSERWSRFDGSFALLPLSGVSKASPPLSLSEVLALVRTKLEAEATKPALTTYGSIDYGRPLDGRVRSKRALLAFSLEWLLRCASLGRSGLDPEPPVDGQPHRQLNSLLIEATLGVPGADEPPTTPEWIESTVRSILKDNKTAREVEWGPVG